METKRNSITEKPKQISLIEKISEQVRLYEHNNLTELLSNSNNSPARFKQLVMSEISKSQKLQEIFTKNPQSLFASILHCAELDLSPSSMVGEFYFVPNEKENAITPVLGYKGLITLLMRSEKIKKIWAEVVYQDDDFIYEMGLEPKLVHFPNHDAERNNDKILCVYVCAKLQDNEVAFKVMSKKEIQAVVNVSSLNNEYYFNDKKDPENWMIKKVVLKQLAKTLPKQDDRIKHAISTDDKIEGGGYLMVDDNDNLKLVQGNIIGKRKNSLYSILPIKNQVESID
jgi:recombination protein RecT